MGNPQAVPENLMSRDLPFHTGKFSGLGLVGGIFAAACSSMAGLPFCVKVLITSYLSVITIEYLFPKFDRLPTTHFLKPYQQNQLNLHADFLVYTSGLFILC